MLAERAPGFSDSAGELGGKLAEREEHFKCRSLHWNDGT